MHGAPPTPVDLVRIEELFRPLREIIRNAITIAQEMLDRAEPGVWTVSIVETARSPERQLELYKRGRVKTESGWVVQSGAKVVTNALPHQTPHCVRTRDGDPCAMAADIRVASRETGANAPDDHPAWMVVGAAAYVAGGNKIASGGMFHSIRDWPHIEWRGWQKLVRNGVLNEVRAS